MAKVYLVRSQKIGRFPETWSLYRVGEGPGRGEGQGFKTKAEAYAFAKKYRHEVLDENRELAPIKTMPAPAAEPLRVRRIWP